MDNNNKCLCDNCSHAEVCKYKDEFDKKIKEINYHGDPLLDLFQLILNCKFYKLKENPMAKVETVSFPVNKEVLFNRIF